MDYNDEPCDAEKVFVIKWLFNIKLSKLKKKGLQLPTNKNNIFSSKITMYWPCLLHSRPHYVPPADSSRLLCSHHVQQTTVESQPGQSLIGWITRVRIDWTIQASPAIRYTTYLPHFHQKWTSDAISFVFKLKLKTTAGWHSNKSERYYLRAVLNGTIDTYRSLFQFVLTYVCLDEVG